jgi:hypothetical protein
VMGTNVRRVATQLLCILASLVRSPFKTRPETPLE